MGYLVGWVRAFLPIALVVAVPAALLWVLLVARARESGRPVRRSMRLAGADILLAVSLGAILLLTVLPGGESSRPASGRSLVPLEDLVRSLGPGMPHDAVDLAVGNLLANLLLFVPFGFALGLRFASVPIVRLLLVCVALSAAIEWVQLVQPLDRSADITDVLTNTLGGLAGLVVARLAIGVVRGGDGARHVR